MLNAEKTTPEERIARIKAETNGRGAEIVVECVGRPEVFPEGLKYLRKAGMYLEQAEDAVKTSMTRESMKVVIDPWME